MTDHRAAWRKSSFSDIGNCVEAATLPAGAGAVALRNSRRPDAGTLVLDAGAASTFVHGVKAGDLDDLIA